MAYTKLAAGTAGKKIADAVNYGGATADSAVTAAAAAQVDATAGIANGKKVAAPASAAAAGTAGNWATDTGFIYVCTATNTWKRVAIATW
jgi:hypothetical protein